MDQGELAAVLESGVFDPIVGLPEGSWLEFKGEPYALDSEFAKYELAKDAAAFGNGAEAAVILVGVVTERVAESPFDTAVRVRPIRRDLVDERRYVDILRSHCYPQLRGLTVTFHPSAADPERGLLAIWIPAQHDDDRPFLVLSPTDDNGRKLQGWLVGLPTRALDETEHMRDSQLHELIRGGRTMGARLDDLEVILAQGLRPRSEPEEQLAEGVVEPERDPEVPRYEMRSQPVLVERCVAVAREFASEPNGSGGQVQLPAFWLGATPGGPVSVPSIFRREGVREILERPPRTRDNGWNLMTGDRAEIIRGDHLFLGERRKQVRYYTDGTLILVARFDVLLTESRGGGDPPRPLKVNPVGLIELTHDFVLTYAALAEQTAPPHTGAQLATGVLAATGSPSGDLFLPPWGIGSVEWEFADVERYPPPDMADFSAEIYRDLGAASVAEVAFGLLERIYPFFKRDVDEIPYVTASRDAVDPGAFQPVR